MKTKQEKQCVEEGWQAAQTALSDAQKLPRGPERLEAPKAAGRLRYEADKRRRTIEEEMDSNKEKSCSRSIKKSK
jgi:hypothetical protein